MVWVKLYNLSCESYLCYFGNFGNERGDWFYLKFIIFIKGCWGFW